jgi:hypothetical protein
MGVGVVRRRGGYEPGVGVGRQLTLFLKASETVVDEEFELTDSVDVPEGRYGADHIGWFGGTSKNRAVYLGTNGMLTKFHGGHLVSVGGTVTAAPSPKVSISLGYTRNAVEVPDGSFSADISSVRATYSVSTKLLRNVLVQYNSLDRGLVMKITYLARM